MPDDNPAAGELVPGYFGDYTVIAVDLPNKVATGSHLSPDCAFQFSLPLHPVSVDHVHSGPAYVGIAWVPGQMDDSVPLTVLSIARNGYQDQISFLFDKGELAGSGCKYRTTSDVSAYFGNAPRRVMVTRKRARVYLHRSGKLEKVDTLARNKAVVVYITGPGEVKPPTGYVNTPSGYILISDLYPDGSEML